MANTQFRGYPLPNEADSIAAEFYKIQQVTFGLIDSDVASLFEALAQKSSVGHSHQISDVTGLSTALEGKMPSNRTFSIGELNDVVGADLAPNGYVLVKVAGKWEAQSAAAAIGAHKHAISDIDGLASAISEAVPAGATMHFARNTAPSGWLKANGALLLRASYTALFAAIGTTFGVGNGTTTFQLPDLRGEFIRGWDDGRTVDPGRAFGSNQTDANKSHSHNATTGDAGSHTHTGTTNAYAHSHTGWTDTQGSHSHFFSVNNQTASGAFPRGTTAGGQQGFNTDAAGAHSHNVGTSTDTHSHPFTTAAAGIHSHSVTVAADGGSEARPRNVALLACIKF